MTPRLLLFAGPNGSGKSTITTPQTLAFYGIPPERYINADDIARSLSESRTDLSQEEREREAFREARTRRKRFQQDGVSFAFETVFSHPSTLLDMQRCRAAGFEIVVLFVTTENAEINVGRVAGRFLAGGHDVPHDRIRARYQRVMALLPRIVEDADRASVYDNSRLPLKVFSFRRGVAQPSRDTMPGYLQAALTAPLAERQAERAALLARFGPMSSPNEAVGEYTGSVSHCGPNYLVQHTETHGQIRHDSLLLESGATAEVGASITVRYRDAAGWVKDYP